MAQNSDPNSQNRILLSDIWKSVGVCVPYLNSQNGKLLSHISQSVGMCGPNQYPTTMLPQMKVEPKFIRTCPMTMPHNMKTESMHTGTYLTKPRDEEKIKAESMYSTNMHRLGMQSFAHKESQQIDKDTTVKIVPIATTTQISTNGSDTGLLTAQRQVQFATLKTRRQELIKNHKPYYRYTPKILKIWQKSDYLKHNNLYKKQVDIEAEKVLEEITLDVSQLIKERSIDFKPFNLEPLKQGMKPIHRKDRWWIVADTKVLLDDMKFIDKLIKSDPTCRMRLPYEALHDLSAMTAKCHASWMRIPARRVVQYLETAIDHDDILDVQGLVESEDLVDSPVATDAVINCCLHLSKLYYYVILLSDDEKRKKQAASVDFSCYTLDEMKTLVQSSFTDKVTNSVKLDIRVTRSFAPSEVRV